MTKDYLDEMLSLRRKFKNLNESCYTPKEEFTKHKRKVIKEANEDGGEKIAQEFVGEPFNVWLDRLHVRANKMAPTTAGELIRAVYLIILAWNEDGSVFYEGEGRIKVGGCAQFIIDTTKEGAFDDLQNIADGDWINGSYEDTISEFASALMDFIIDTPSLFTEKNTTNCEYLDLTSIDEDTYEETYKLPYRTREAMLEANVDEADIIKFFYDTLNIDYYDKVRLGDDDYVNHNLKITYDEDTETFKFEGLSWEQYDYLDSTEINDRVMEFINNFR